jgi:PAS domain S-box-containing protein
MNLFGLDQKHTQWWCYGVAILAPAIALLIKLLLNSLIEYESPFLLFFAATVVSARYGGIKAGVLASVLATLASNYFFFSPKYSLDHNFEQNLQLGIFLLENIAISKLVASLSFAQGGTEQSKTEALQHQDTLRQTEERFCLLVESVRDYAIFMLDPSGHIISWNLGASRIQGYEANEIIGQHFSCFYTHEDIESEKPKRELEIATVQEQFEDQGWRVRRDGSKFWANVAIAALRDETGNLKGFSQVVCDLTERKQSEEPLRQSEERLKLALSAAQIGTWDWNIVTNQVIWSENQELLFGLTPGSFKGTYEAFIDRVHPEDRQLFTKVTPRAIEETRICDREFRITCLDGSIRWLAGKGRIIYDETGSAVRMLGININITAQKQAAEQINASLREKEVLLTELHHRVKNNLQIISSFLNLQSGYIEDAKTLEILKAAENRVISMALVHEQLYLSQNLAQIDSASYIKQLASNLFGSYNINTDAIKLKINVDKILLVVNTAITCGLIINELISNALKYAFVEGAAGEIRINFQSSDRGKLILVVSDNGIGLPENFELQKTESLGLQIVQALTNQLQGEIEIERNNGTEFRITFPE